MIQQQHLFVSVVENFQSLTLATTLQQVGEWHGLLGPPMEFPLGTSAVTSFRMTQVFQNQVQYVSDWISANPAN